MNQILTLQEAADRLGLSVERTRQFCVAGRLRARKWAGRWAIQSSVIDKFASKPRFPGRPQKKFVT